MSENNNEFDLGSSPDNEGFDPFADDDGADITETDVIEIVPDAPVTEEKAETTVNEPEPAGAADKTATPKDEKATQSFAEKLPVFEYAGATEDISDTSKTFDELRIEKATDFPELDDGKRVSWTVEYGKITKAVTDAKGTSIGKMKTDIENSKEFEDSLKKRGADKNPACKIKPRVTAQSKGLPSSYRGVFGNADEALSAGKVISIIPGKDGRVYEMRNTDMGRFITPISGCEELSDIRAGFTPALPPIPKELMMQVISFFRKFSKNDSEVLVNVYWDTSGSKFILDAPVQVVSKVSVYSGGNSAYSDVRYIHYMDIHSHNTMKAYFSPTDDCDEKATRLYTVMGELDKYFPTIVTRIANGGKFHEIDPMEVFENIEHGYPHDWEYNVSRRVVKANSGDGEPTKEQKDEI